MCGAWIEKFVSVPRSEIGHNPWKLLKTSRQWISACTRLTRRHVSFAGAMRWFPSLYDASWRTNVLFTRLMGREDDTVLPIRSFEWRVVAFLRRDTTSESENESSNMRLESRSLVPCEVIWRNRGSLVRFHNVSTHWNTWKTLLYRAKTFVAGLVEAWTSWDSTKYNNPPDTNTKESTHDTFARAFGRTSLSHFTRWLHDWW